MKQIYSNLAHPKSGRPTTQHIYRNDQGKAVLIANRFNKPDGGKYFLPFDIEKAIWKAPDIHSLYNLDKITNADPAKPVIMVEGEKCADALAQIGYLATTTYGGSNAVHKTDLSPLHKRNVILWPDYDDAGLSYVTKAANSLRNVYVENVSIIPISETLLRNVNVPDHKEAANSGNPITYTKGWDVADAIVSGWGKDEIDKLFTFAVL
jgi:hypothetical protein